MFRFIILRNNSLKTIKWKVVNSKSLNFYLLSRFPTRGAPDKAVGCLRIEYKGWESWWIKNTNIFMVQKYFSFFALFWLFESNELFVSNKSVISVCIKILEILSYILLLFFTCSVVMHGLLKMQNFLFYFFCREI